MNVLLRNIRIVSYSALLTELFVVSMIVWIVRFDFLFSLYITTCTTMVFVMIAFTGLCIIHLVVHLFKWSELIHYWLKMVFATLFFIPWVMEYEFALPSICFLTSYIITISVITYFHWTELSDSKNSKTFTI